MQNVALTTYADRPDETYRANEDTEESYTGEISSLVSLAEALPGCRGNVPAGTRETNHLSVPQHLSAIHSLIGERSPQRHGLPPQSCAPPLDRESLYVAFAPLIKRLMRQYGSTAELRQDLVGEIYCRFCALVDAYDPARGVPLRPYLVRQLTASTYTFVRSQWNLQRREASTGWLEAYNATEPGYDPTVDWLSALSQQQLAQCLPSAIDQLSVRQRKIVRWRYYNGLSFEEIARKLDIEPSTVRSLLRHGINNLRKNLQVLDPCSPT